MRPAFTLTELLVVIGIIALLLGVGLPAFSAMSIDARNTSATQSMAGIINRAYILSLGDNTMTAVRFAPAAWDTDTGGDAGALRNRQKAIVYRYKSTDAADPNKFTSIRYGERFERVESGPELTLPDDVWAAPAESLYSDTTTSVPQPSDNRHVLRGRPGVFSATWNGAPAALSWNSTSTAFLDADDFTIVFDPRTGLRRGPSLLGQDSVTLVARDPTLTDPSQIDQALLTRRYFGGVLLYQRGPFLAQGEADTESVANSRIQYLQRTGRPFYVGAGGSMVSGTPRAN